MFKGKGNRAIYVPTHGFHKTAKMFLHPAHQFTHHPLESKPCDLYPKTG